MLKQPPKNRMSANSVLQNDPSSEKKNNSLSRVAKKIQSDFITSTSHQFRTPLATFQSSIELLEYYIKEGNVIRQKEMIEKIKRTLRYLNATIENMTTLYKYSIAKQKLLLKRIKIREFSNELLEEVVLGISEAHFILINIEPELQEIICDEFILKQILLNLIHNAIKFSPEGGQIILEIFRSGRFIEFVVKDEGIGIDKHDLKKIFTPFIRGKNATTFPGSGLGLAIVKNMVQIHKAKITFTSKVNVGTAFHVKIPQKVSQ